MSTSRIDMQPKRQALCDKRRILSFFFLCKEEVIFAVVVERSVEDLATGMLTVQLIFPQNDEDDKNQNEGEAAGFLQLREKVRIKSVSDVVGTKKVFTMIETNAYFEAYRHVLSGLKETTELPLDRYIVHLSRDLQAPLYLRPSVTGGSIEYDFSRIIKTERTRREFLRELSESQEEPNFNPILEAPKIFPATKLAAPFSRYHPASTPNKKVEILQGAWPSPEDMNLDPSQAEAVKLALTKEMAIIQGPPGTGKTHVGLAVMKLLLDNKIVWSGSKGYNDSCPLLVVCYTNHALDQFVEGIAQFAITDKIVRVGGRSKNEAVERFCLKNIRQSGFRCLYSAEQAAKDRESELQKIEKVWNTNTEKLLASLHCIPSLRELEKFIPPYLFQYFGLEKTPTDGCTNDQRKIEDNKQNQVLLSWLGINHNETNVENDLKWAENVAEEPEKQHDPFLVQDELMEKALKRLLGTDQIPRNLYKDMSEGSMKIRAKEIGAISLAEIEEYDHKHGEDDEWEQQRHQRRKQKRRMQILVRGTEVMTEFEENQVTNIYDLSRDDRWRLYRTWLNRWRRHCRSGIDQQVEEYNRLALQLTEARHQQDSEILQHADVVAATTTGAAKYRDIINKLDCKIVIIEEAAEILEAHVVTAMPRSTNHLILIGDHKQLRPSPTVYELGRKYNLEISLFERLLKKIPHVTLSRQHRMRPVIADLIRPHIYKNLEDHESVSNRHPITGVSKPLFFISHAEKEDVIIEGGSRKNVHEADFMIAFCQYIITQGYEPKQVTILTMYSGQMFTIRERASKRLHHKVRVTAVDNFQGEENDIILLSLVRSNEEAKIGFLGVENRICVAMSRAKLALYCIGNMEMMASESRTWRTIVHHLRERGFIGEALTLQCKHHPDRKTQVKSSKDFDKVPEGGCGHPCKTRLPCGHVCPKPCHPYDHTGYDCTKPCDRTVPCEKGHICKKECWEPCEPCKEILPKLMPKCGHIQPILCQTSPDDVNCMEEVEVELLCGHRPTVHCYQAQSPSLSLCKESCREVLDCGHPCQGSCYDCCQGRLHVPCAKICSRKLVCGHVCDAFCDSCLPCRSACRTRCKHRKCDKKCGQPCIPCREKCDWMCDHFKCSRLCSEPCDRPPCNKSCQKKLKCGHHCIGLCGEPCPKLCKICDRSKVEELLTGEDDYDNARFVQLEDCGHLFTYQFLDSWMNHAGEGSVIEMKECPKCKVPIWHSTRYGSVVNLLLNSLNKFKENVWGDASRLKNAIKRKFKATLKGRSGRNSSAAIRDAYERFKKNVPKSEIYLIAIEFGRLLLLESLCRVQNLVCRNIDSKRIKQTRQDILQDVQRIQRWICLRRTKYTGQEEYCFGREIARILQALKLFKVDSTMMLSAENGGEIDQAVREKWEPIAEHLHCLLFENVKPFDEAKENEVKQLYEEANMKPRLLSHHIDKMTEKEKESTTPTAQSFSEIGRWGWCTQGHVYLKRDRREGQRETSHVIACPECKEASVEISHRFFKSDRVATESESDDSGSME